MRMKNRDEPSPFVVVGIIVILATAAGLAFWLTVLFDELQKGM